MTKLGPEDGEVGPKSRRLGVGGSVLGLTALRLAVASLALGETTPRGLALARLVPVGTSAATLARIRRGRLLAGWSRSRLVVLLLRLLRPLSPA